MATACSRDDAHSWLQASSSGRLLGLTPTMRPGMSACLLGCTAAMLQLTDVPCWCQAARRRRSACMKSQAVRSMQLHPDWIQLLPHTLFSLWAVDRSVHPGCATGGCDCCMAR